MAEPQFNDDKVTRGDVIIAVSVARLEEITKFNTQIVAETKIKVDSLDKKLDFIDEKVNNLEKQMIKSSGENNTRFATIEGMIGKTKGDLILWVLGVGAASTVIVIGSLFSMLKLMIHP